MFCALVEHVINWEWSLHTQEMRTPPCLSFLVEPLFSFTVEPGLQRLLENPFAAHLLHVRVDYGIHSSWNTIWLVSINLGLCGMLQWCTEHDVTFDRSLPRLETKFVLSSLCAAVTWQQVSMVTNSPVGHRVFPQQKQDDAVQNCCIEWRVNSICCSDYILATGLVNGIIGLLLHFRMMSLWSSED